MSSWNFPSATSSLCAVLASAVLLACGSSPPGVAGAPPAPEDAVCGENPLLLSYDFMPEQVKSYAYLPFTVPVGTARIELGYRWTDRSQLPGTPLNATTVDLGLWDERGLREGFRGWGGSRQGRLDRDTGPVYIEAQAADRGFEAGAINAGQWHVELGLAATGDAGADVEVELRCLAQAIEAPQTADEGLDPAYVARPGPGWFAADFHVHGFHSNASAPDYDGVVQQARDAGLDILMLTEYVTARHHRQLRAVQERHPDLLLWPGREIITYFGHMNIHGEVPGVPEYRHGFDGISLGDVQQDAAQAGALIQINHPTTFPPPLFSNLCRGCAFELDAFIDFDQVQLIEIVNGPAVATGDDVGLPVPGETENPFIATAIDYWLEKLRQGHRITAVSGSDSKGVDAIEERARKGYGSSATQIYAEALSRPAVDAALRAGRAYVQARGVLDSPQAELIVTAANGDVGSFGSQLSSESATMRIELQGASGQLLQIFNDNLLVLSIPVSTNSFVHEQPISRLPLTEGPLGSIWRFEVRDQRSRTLIGNPVFLQP